MPLKIKKKSLEQKFRMPKLNCSEKDKNFQLKSTHIYKQHFTLENLLNLVNC